MTPPDQIPFSSVELGERGRSEYHSIDLLAGLIRDNGLIQPIVLVPLPNNTDGVDFGFRFGLDAGGRRYHALKWLLEEGSWDGILHHAVTSDPARPGYILKGEEFVTPFQRAMTEIVENLGREDPDWRDQVKMIVQGFKLAQTEAHRTGEELLMRSFGSMIGVEYTKLKAAITIHEEVVLNPDKFKDCTSIRGACTKLLSMNAAALNKLSAEKSLTEDQPTLGPKVKVQNEPEPVGEDKPLVVPLTLAFKCGDSLEYMRKLEGPTFDHIVTDPDYGVSIDKLEAGVQGAGGGVSHTSVDHSLDSMYDFITSAHKIIKDQGFLVFWYDLDHHEKLQKFAVKVGFRVQRWPLIWHKTDYFSNADTAHNFTKNMEYAMVCRKPNAILSQVQKTSIFQCSSGTTTKDFNHPFAKPADVWRWIYSAIAIKGQTVYDPFLGSASAACAAVGWGLKAVGHELSQEHYAHGLMNLQAAYKKLLGSKVTFS